MKSLIRQNSKRLGVMPREEVEAIVSALERAIAPCELRNLLAHGDWWDLDPHAQIITVRRGTVRGSESRHVPINVTDIQGAESDLNEIEIELYKRQRAIEERIGPI